MKSPMNAVCELGGETNGGSWQPSLVCPAELDLTGADEQQSKFSMETNMIDINNVETIPSDIDFLGLTIPAPQVAAKPAPSAILEAFKAIKGTHRYDALMCLARNFGKPVSRAKLIAAVYGKDADEKAQIGALGMCLEGGRKSIKKLNLPYRIVKENATIALVAAN